jgi:hypothetical protein
MSATSARSAIAATAHGRAEVTFLVSPGGLPAENVCVPAAVPQRWQNFAPGVNSERHPEHVA